MPKRNLSTLVRNATDDLTPIRRGRGLDAMLSDDEDAASAAAPNTPTPDDMSTSKQVNMSTSNIVNK